MDEQASQIGAAFAGFTNFFGVMIPPTFLLLTAVIGFFVFQLWRSSRKHGFNLFDIITDKQPNGTSRTSGIKTLYLVSFMVTSGVLIDAAVKNSPALPVLYAAYLATWCVALIAKVVYDKRDIPPLPGGSVTATATVTTQGEQK